MLGLLFLIGKFLLLDKNINLSQYVNENISIAQKCVKFNLIKIQLHGTFKHKMTLVHSNVSFVTRHHLI